jgi:hypothetical protein
MAKAISKTTDLNVTHHKDTHCNDTQHNDTQHNDTQHSDTQHRDTKHVDTQHNDTQHNGLNSRATVLSILTRVFLYVIMLSAVFLRVTAPRKRASLDHSKYFFPFEKSHIFFLPLYSFFRTMRGEWR